MALTQTFEHKWKVRWVEANTVEHNWKVKGVELTATISPCSFMYRGYPVQFKVSIPNGGDAFLKIDGRTVETMDEKEARGFLSNVALVKCSRCDSPAFDTKTIDTNRGGLCEGCFMADLNVEFEKSAKKEAARVEKQDVKMRKQGFTYKAAAWVHPQRGDDYMLDLYFKRKPTKSQIQSELKRSGSRVLDDYTIVKLAPLVN